MRRATPTSSQSCSRIPDERADRPSPVDPPLTGGTPHYVCRLDALGTASWRHSPPGELAESPTGRGLVAGGGTDTRRTSFVMGATRLTLRFERLPRLPRPGATGWSRATAVFGRSMASNPLNRPVVAMVPYNNGFLVVASDGGDQHTSGAP